MAMRLGSGSLWFEPVENWEKLPAGWTLIDVVGVTVDPSDNVYVFHRGEHPVIVFDRDGNVLRTFGEGCFSKRPHGINIGPDDSVYCVDDELHTIQKFTLDGKLLMTLGSPRQPAPKWQGKPFNRPTHVAVSRRTGHLYVSDGYGNSKIHKFTPDGRHVLSWGDTGIDPGQFIRPHNVVVDRDDFVYVADREAHRIQVFDSDGKLVTIWQNIYRPDGICLDAEGNFFIAELTAFEGLDDAPGLGHRVSIYNLQGKMLTRIGAPEEGEGLDQFIAPHGCAVDSRGDLYVGDVAFGVRGRFMNPPRHLKCFRKFRRVRNDM